MNLMDEFHDKIIKNNKVDDKIGEDLNFNEFEETYETYVHFNIHLFSPYTSNILKLSQNIELNFTYQNELEFLEYNDNSISWEIRTYNNKRSILLQVFNLNNDNEDNEDLIGLISSRAENFNAPKDIFLLGIEVTPRFI
ncbi:unnamed protein product [Rhizophagus irregularis]|nr:unnamed protein product [Rhizophagus irregularis]